MRVMVVHPGADCSVSDVHDGLVDGLRRNGVEVESLNLNDRLWFYQHAQMPDPKGNLRPAFNELESLHLLGREIVTDAYYYWPHVIVIVSGFHVPTGILPLLRSRGHHLVLWATETPYEDDKQLAIAHHFDTVIVSDPVTLDQYRAINQRTWYLPHSYDPQVHRPGRPSKAWASDFCFVGTGFPSRVEFLEKVDALGGFDGVDVLLGGNWQFDDTSPVNRWARNPHRRQWMLNREAVRCYRSSKVGVNLYRIENSAGRSDGVAMGPREVEMAATGLFFLRESRPESDAILPMLPTFDGPEDFADKLRWWLDHDDDRLRAAQEARRATADRTFTNTASELLRRLQGAIKPGPV
jgi:spore maturation protein CgeB